MWSWLLTNDTSLSTRYQSTQLQTINSDSILNQNQNWGRHLMHQRLTYHIPHRTTRRYLQRTFNFVYDRFFLFFFFFVSFSRRRESNLISMSEKRADVAVYCLYVDAQATGFRIYWCVWAESDCNRFLFSFVCLFFVAFVARYDISSYLLLTFSVFFCRISKRLVTNW